MYKDTYRYIYYLLKYVHLLDMYRPEQSRKMHGLEEPEGFQSYILAGCPVITKPMWSSPVTRMAAQLFGWVCKAYPYPANAIFFQLKLIQTLLREFERGPVSVSYTVLLPCEIWRRERVQDSPLPAGDCKIYDIPQAKCKYCLGVSW